MTCPHCWPPEAAARAAQNAATVAREVAAACEAREQALLRRLLGEATDAERNEDTR